MAWIESHDSLGNHPKMRKLAQMLHISEVQVVGHLHFLWWWAITYAQDGDISRLSNSDIALAARWEGNAQEFVDALMNCGYGGPGFLEREGDSITIHHWWDYAGKLIEKREQEAQRKRAYRERYEQHKKQETELQRNSNGTPTDIVGTSAGQDADRTRTSASHPTLNQPTNPLSTREAHKKRASRPSKRDPRTDHPAIQAVFAVTGKNPPKEIYDDIIAQVGDAPDLVRMKAVFKDWRAHGFNAVNLKGWLFDWYVKDISQNGQARASPAEETPSQKLARVLREHPELDTRNTRNGTEPNST